jgi:hypothetical protein
MVTTALLLQVPLTPYTVYVVFTEGVTLIVLVSAPVVHEYEEAPVAARFAGWPLQMVGVPVMPTTKVLVTVTTATTVLAAGQPTELVPVTE